MTVQEDSTNRSLLVTAGDISFEMIHVQGQEAWMMGSTADDALDREKPFKKKVSDFYLGRDLVSQRLWQAVMGKNPSYFKGMDRPVESVSWHDCQEFLEKLSGITKEKFRLPSEVEWEFAATGGIYAKQGLYAGSRILEEVGHFEDNSHRESQDCGEKYSNELGFYDMSGNLWEWCQDHYREEAAQPGDSSPWQGGDRAAYRVLRGGTWWGAARYCRAACRDLNWPEFRDRGLGLRLALSPPV